MRRLLILVLIAAFFLLVGILIVVALASPLESTVLAVDYLFVALAFYFILGSVFFLLAFLIDQFPFDIVFFLLASIFLWEEAIMWPAVEETWGPAVMWGFVLLGMLSFVFAILSGLQALNVYKPGRWGRHE